MNWIGLVPGLLAGLGHDTVDKAGDPGRFIIFQDADSLVSLLNIEISVVFVADDRVPDALFQVGGAQLDPLDGELRIPAQQGHEARREGGDASGGLGANDAVGRDLHQTHGDAAVGSQIAHNLVQHLGIYASSPGLTLPDLLLAPLQGFGIFFHSFQTAHDRSSFEKSSDGIIIQPIPPDYN